jgi:hypothetical protein
MHRLSYQYPTSGNFIQKALAYMGLGAALVSIVMLASFFFAFALAIVLVAGSALALRVWWIRRKLKKSGVQTLDGQYVVITRRRADRF